MSSLSRRRFVQTASAASVAFATGLPGLARAQSPIAL
ncbi:MAG TPA: twin-arginine translocation signal domain-containing protein, partial [Polaromonas sp.]